jgi:hypothetical protein
MVEEWAVHRIKCPLEVEGQELQGRQRLKDKGM